MDRQILNFTANEQVLSVDEPIRISTNKVNYIEAHFALGDNWSGYDSVRAVWFNDYQTISTVLDSQGVCRVPFEVMKRKGQVKVDLVGSISEGDVLTDRLTSYPVVAVVVDCVAPITGAETSPITPSQFEQYVAIVQALVGSVRDIDRIELNPDYTLTIYYSDGTSDTTSSIRGATGNGIASIAKTGSSGTNPVVDTYTVTYTGGNTFAFTVTNGKKGDTGATGATGNGIQSIYKTGTSGLVDTYTILYTNGNTTTFEVTNGQNGSLASTVLASTYSSSKTYAVGDYVYYSGNLYRCTTAITTAEAWTSGHWTQVALADDVSDLKSDLNLVINYDFDTVSNTFINKNNGEIGTSAAYIASEYIPVSDYVLLYSYCGNDNSGYAFYDEGFNALSYGGIYSFNRTWTKLVAPDGAKYFRATCGASQATEFKIKMPINEVVSTMIKNGTSNLLGSVDYGNGYIINNSGTIGSFVENQNYISAKIMVHAGETYYIAGRGASSARLWSLHNADGSTSRVASEDARQLNSYLKIEIQDDERYLVFNSYTSQPLSGIVLGHNSQSAVNTRDIIKEVKDDFDDILATESYTFKNNISTDGVSNLPNCTIVKDGVASDNNYGLSGSRYVFELPAKKFHLYFEFKQTDAVESVGGQTPVAKRLVTAFGNSYFIMQCAGTAYNGAELLHDVRIQCVSGSNADSLQLINGSWYQRVQGNDAFSIQYTNAITENSIGKITFTDTKCIVNVDGNVSEIDVSVNTTISDLVTALNNISGISAEIVFAYGKTYGDLLPVVSKRTSAGTEMGLILSGTLYNNEAFTDNPKIYIPLAYDDVWHSVEMIFDPGGRVTAAFDGITVSAAFSGTLPNNSLMINQNNMPIVIRNLELDYDSIGDAEVIDALAIPDQVAKKQLISPHNPRLLIYEGHGVDVCADEDAPLTDNMACSIERLRVLFNEAKEKGYVSITWEDVINWKLQGTPLPKRCFTMMFDDWRFENYVDYDKRKPFVDYNVKAGLAVITNEHSLTDTYTINGISYAVEDIVDIVMKAGWYCTSHTHTHTRIRDSKPSDTALMLKTSVLEADKYGIHSNIIVYPQGEVAPIYLPTIKHSGFALGLTITANNYNCAGTNDCFLVRVELGTRVPLSTVLYPLV